MDHHSQQPMSDENKSLLEQQLEMLTQAKKQLELGATGKFPQGKLTENDEGELQFAVTTYRGQVIINFGKPIEWAGLNPDQARMLADALNHRAREAEKYIKNS